jgi:hypothetical protein
MAHALAVFSHWRNAVSGGRYSFPVPVRLTFLALPSPLQTALSAALLRVLFTLVLIVVLGARRRDSKYFIEIGIGNPEEWLALAAGFALMLAITGIIWLLKR